MKKHLFTIFLILVLSVAEIAARSITNYNEYDTDIRMDEAEAEGNVGATFHRDDLVKISFTESNGFTFRYLAYDTHCEDDRMNSLKFTVRVDEKSYHLATVSNSGYEDDVKVTNTENAGYEDQKYGKVYLTETYKKQNELNDISL